MAWRALLCVLLLCVMHSAPASAASRRHLPRKALLQEAPRYQVPCDTYEPGSAFLWLFTLQLDMVPASLDEARGSQALEFSQALKAAVASVAQLGSSNVTLQSTVAQPSGLWIQLSTNVAMLCEADAKEVNNRLLEGNFLADELRRRWGITGAYMMKGFQYLSPPPPPSLFPPLLAPIPTPVNSPSIVPADTSGGDGFIRIGIGAGIGAAMAGAAALGAVLYFLRRKRLREQAGKEEQQHKHAAEPDKLAVSWSAASFEQQLPPTLADKAQPPPAEEEYVSASEDGASLQTAPSEMELEMQSKLDAVDGKSGNLPWVAAAPPTEAKPVGPEADVGVDNEPPGALQAEPKLYDKRKLRHVEEGSSKADGEPPSEADVDVAGASSSTAAAPAAAFSTATLKRVESPLKVAKKMEQQEEEPEEEVDELGKVVLKKVTAATQHLKKVEVMPKPVRPLISEETYKNPEKSYRVMKPNAPSASVTWTSPASRKPTSDSVPDSTQAGSSGSPPDATAAGAQSPSPPRFTLPDDAPEFIASDTFTGAKPGYLFNYGPQGLGYYADRSMMSNPVVAIKDSPSKRPPVAGSSSSNDAAEGDACAQKHEWP